MTTRIRALFVAISAFGLGCALTPTFTTGYLTEQSALRASPIDGDLAVARFVEDRPPRYYSTTGRLFLTYIPFIPYVSMPFERLEESIEIQSDAIESKGPGLTRIAKQNVAPPLEEYYYPNSFPRALVEDLSNAGLFREVKYIGDGPADGFRYVLTGVLHETPLTNTTTSYGLGMAGVLLWILPIPIAKFSANIDLDLTLTDQETGEVVWQKRLGSEIRRYITLYTSSAMIYGRGGAFSLNVVPPPSDSKVDRRSLFSWHFESLRRAMLDSRQELAEALATRN